MIVVATVHFHCLIILLFTSVAISVGFRRAHNQYWKTSYLAKDTASSLVSVYYAQGVCERVKEKWNENKNKKNDGGMKKMIELN